MSVGSAPACGNRIPIAILLLSISRTLYRKKKALL